MFARVIEVECSGGIVDFASSGVTHSLDEQAHQFMLLLESRCPSPRRSLLKLNPKPQSLYYFTSKIPSIQCHIYHMDSRSNLLRTMRRFPCKVASDVQVESSYLRSPHSLAWFTGRNFGRIAVGWSLRERMLSAHDDLTWFRQIPPNHHGHAM